MKKLNFKNTITDYSKGRSCCNKRKHFNKTRLTDNIKQSIYGIMVFCGLTVGTCAVAQSMFGEKTRTLSKSIFEDSNMNISPDTLPLQLKSQQPPIAIVPFVDIKQDSVQKDSMQQDNNVAKKSKQKNKSSKRHSNFIEHGIASHMGYALHGRKQASGERHDKNALICAHKTLPFGTRIRVTDIKTGKSVIVRVTDRGPFGPGRIVDLSLAAARELNIVKSGITKVKIEKVI